MYKPHVFDYNQPRAPYATVSAERMAAWAGQLIRVPVAFERGLPVVPGVSVLPLPRKRPCPILASAC